MKLKNLAALFLRLLGVAFILSGFTDALSGVLDTHKVGAIEAAFEALVVGSLIVYFSKRLGFMISADHERVV